MHFSRGQKKTEKNQAFPRRSSVFLCSKTTRKRLLLRLLLLINPFVISYFLTTAVKNETGTFTYEKPFFAVLRRVLKHYSSVTLDAFLFIPLIQADSLTAHVSNKSLIYISFPFQK